MTHRTASATLAIALLAFLPSAAPLIPANARPPAADSGRGPATAATAAYLTMTGDINWKTSIPINTPGYTGHDDQTGNFHVDMLSVAPGTVGDLWNNLGSSYAVTDTTNIQGTSTSCPSTTKGSLSLSGALLDAQQPDEMSHILSIQIGLPVSPWVGFEINVDATEKLTQTDCNGTVTYSGTVFFLPTCYNTIPESHLGGITGKLTGKSIVGTIPINCSGTRSDGTTYSATGKVAITQGCAPPNQLSGRSWASKFPNSKSISDLSGTFRRDVTRFVAAMRSAGITVVPLSTLRPPERAYLMHYSWLINSPRPPPNGHLSPEAVPAFVPAGRQSSVDICWVHTRGDSVDLPASIAAAAQMVSAFHIDKKLKVAPALKSLHTMGLAIDMRTTWSQSTITIVDGNGHSVVISTSPRTGLNSKLMAVGATYGVFHFCYPPGTCKEHVPADDPKHWSVNGH